MFELLGGPKGPFSPVYAVIVDYSVHFFTSFPVLLAPDSAVIWYR